MSIKESRILLESHYRHAAQEYLRRLPLERIMEATPQATQRKITLESLDLVHAQRPDIQFFNELLVQYPLPRRKRPGQVVPDNMVVVHPEPIQALGSYDVPLQPVAPFWVLEYVSPSNRRKDYDDNVRKYEHELRVPYYLLFAPEAQEVILYRLGEGRYVSVAPDAEGRWALPELELSVGLLDRWVRFWFRGTLLPLPADLQKALDETRVQLADMTRRAEDEHRRAEDERRRADALAEQVARLQARLAERGDAIAEGSD